MNMKNIIKYLFVLIMFIPISGCQKSFLDKEPTQNISADQIQVASITNPAIAKGMILGIYSLMIQTFSGLGNGHDDFGQKSCDITTDMLSGDMALHGATYGWFEQISELQTTTTDRHPEMYWKYYYRVIKAANEIIDGLGGNAAEISDPENAAYYGQAKALRAHSYFYLANLYQHNYSDNSSQPCVPLYDSQLAGTAAPLATLSQIYALIVSDLEDAVVRLAGYNRGSKTEVNEYVAKGMLAYAYLTTGQNALAAATAQDVIDNSGATVMDKDEILDSGFRSVNIPGWLWGVDLTTDNTGSLLTFWGMVDIFTYSYAGVGDTKGMDNGLYALIPDTDVRKNQFQEAFAAEDWLPIGKFYDAGKTVFGDRSWTNDEVFMRVAEMYLIKAEALARSGADDAGARTALLGLIDDRDTDAATRVAGLSGQALLDEIYLQWRIEMWGEGKSYFALKRFKGTVARGSNHLNLAGATMQHNDDRLILAIPEDEINNNPMLSTPVTPSASAKASEGTVIPK